MVSTCFFVGNSDMTMRINAFDWAQTTLGKLASWPGSVRTVVEMMLHSPLPIVTLWGEQGVMIYNDAYSAFAGARHPQLLGSNVREGWPEVAAFNDNVIKRVFRQAETLSYKDQELVLNRGDGGKKVWLNLDYSPVFGDNHAPLGVIAIVGETTDKVLADQELQNERRRLQQMFTQAPSFMALLEGPEHRFVFTNAAYQQLTGSRQLLGQRVSEAIPEAIDQGYVKLLDKVFVSGEVFRVAGARFDVKSNSDAESQRRYLDFVYQPITDANGVTTGIFVDGIDVTDRVIAQEAIKTSEAQFRSFAQAVPNQVWTSGIDGLLDWFNERVGEYSGRSNDDLAGDLWARIVHPHDRPDAARSWAAAVATCEQYETEFRILRADGEYRWHLIRALPIRDAKGNITRWIGTNTDIHDQKLAKAEIAKDLNRLWKLSQELMLVCDYEGMIVAVNPSGQRLLGWSEREMVGHPLTDFLHEDDLRQTTAELMKLSQGAATLAFENRYRRRDGSYRLFAWTAVPDAGQIHGVGRDVTEERSITKDNERIWNLSPVLKVVATNDGIVTAVNPSWNRVLGWTNEETLGHNILEFIDLESRKNTQRRLPLLASGKAITASESTLMTKEGHRRRISWTAVPEDNKIYAFGRDITPESEAAEALALSETALRQAQKMEAVGQLTGGIAHDFNNLLQVIGGNLQLLLKDTAGNERAERRLQSALEGVARGSRLAAQLLAFGRRQPLAPKVVNLGRLVRSMDDMLRRAIGETIQVETIVAGGLWNTLVDTGNVENALLNLAINARDAMEGGGKLTIEAGNAFLDQRYARLHTDVTPGQYVLLAVTDTGSGIPTALLEKVFDPFFSTKPEGKGTGLGLSMVYGFVKQSGGHVKIYSEPGEGTTIKIYLPRSMQTEEDLVVRPSGPVTGGSETILVVEDDRDVRETVIEILADLGYKVLQAGDAQSALAIVESGMQIDLLFTDVVMPGNLKSAQLARMAVERLPNLAVLFTSGYTENSIVHAGRLDEGVELLSKPYTTETLALRLRHLLKGTAQKRQIEIAKNGPAVSQLSRSILLCEDDFLIRLATTDMLTHLGHVVLEAANAESALRLLSDNKIDLLLTDIGLPDLPGTVLAEKARAIAPALPVIFATGQIDLQSMNLNDNTRAVIKPYGINDLETAISDIFCTDS